jgi:hypothetical protein
VRLFGEAVENIDQLGESLRLLRFPFGDTIRDAFLDVKPQNRETDPVQRCFGRRQLLKNVYAEARLLHHPADAADLTFDSIEACDKALLLQLI